VPNADHGITVNGAFAQRKTREFFERTLQHKVLPMDNRRDAGSDATSMSGAAN
jgi:hypothetical protein